MGTIREALNQQRNLLKNCEAALDQCDTRDDFEVRLTRDTRLRIGLLSSRTHTIVNSRFDRSNKREKRCH